MQLYGLFFFLSFMICILITLAKIYNALNAFSFYDGRIAVLLFVSFLISWVVMLMTFMLNPTITILRPIFLLGNVFFMVNTMFFILEVIMIMMAHFDGLIRGRWVPPAQG